MPSNLGDINVRIGAIFEPLENAFRKIDRRLSRSARKFENVGKSLSTSLTAPLVAVGAAAVNTFAGFDKLEKGLEAITGDAETAQNQFKGLLDAVKDSRTTLDLKGATTAALQLQAVGVEGNRAINTLKQLGIAATVSGASSDDIGEVGRQLAQAAAKGSILQQELRIILERIPALAGIIKNEFGTVTAEGLRAAGVSADQFISRLTKAIEENERFQNVQGGLSKQLETFKINLQLAGNELGKSISKAINLEENLSKLSAQISNLVEGFSNLPERAQKFIVRLAGVLAAIGPLNLAVAQFIKLRLGFVAAASAMTDSLKKLAVGVANTIVSFKKLDSTIAKFTKASVLVVAVAALAAVFLEVKRNIEVATRAARDLREIQTETTKQTNQQTSATAALVDILRDENASREEKQRALNLLQQQNPKYFGSLDIEKSKISDITKAFEDYRKAITLATRERVAFAKLEEVESRIFDLQQRFEKATDSGTSFSDLLINSISGGAFRAGGELAAIVAELKQLEDERTKILDLIEKTNSEISRTGTATAAAVTPTLSSAGTGTATAATGEASSELRTRLIAPDSILGSDLQFRFESLKANLEEVGQGFEALKPKIAALPTDPVTAFLTDVQTRFDAIGRRGRVLGEDELTIVKNQFDLLRQSLGEAAVSFGLNSEAVDALKEKLSELGFEAEKTTDLQDKMTAATARGISIFGDYVSQAISGQKSVADAFKAAGLQIINVLLSTAIAHVLEDAFSSFPAPIAAAIGAAGAAIVNASFSSLVGLQDGGIIPPGFPNDTFFARLSSGEAVIPLDRLNDFVGTESDQLTVNGLIRGNNIHLANEKTARRQARIGV